VIEDAASRLFAEQGYARTTLDEVARAAGVTKPVLYQHFASKRDLHLTLLAKHRDALLSELAGGLTGDASLLERMPRVADAWFAHVEKNPYAWSMLFRDTTGDPEVQSFYREMQSTARAVLVSLIGAEGDLDVPHDRIEPLAELVRSAMTGLALWWRENREVERKLLTGVVVQMLEGGLRQFATDESR
jgi:AcrR family transcriptional regulator